MSKVSPKDLALRGLKAAKFGRSNSLMLSHPKAGRTWLRAAMSKAVSLEHDLDENYYALHASQSSLRIPYLVFTHGDSASIARGENLSALKGKRVIFLVRNLLDVQVSYYHQVSKRRKRFQGTLSEFIRDESYGMRKIVEYHNHVIQSKPLFAEYFPIYYEEMHRDLVAVLDACFQFLGVPVSNKNLVKAQQFTEFSRMHQREKKEALLEQGEAKGINVDALKARKGQVGGYVEEMTEEDIEYCKAVISGHLTVTL